MMCFEYFRVVQNRYEQKTPTSLCAHVEMIKKTKKKKQSECTSIAPTIAIHYRFKSIRFVSIRLNRQATTNNIRFTYVSKPNQIRDNLIEGQIGGGVANNDMVENLPPKIYMIDINFEHS